MNSLNFEKLGVESLDQDSIQNTSGGFIPLVILGIKLSAGCVTSLFCAGIGVGAMVAHAQHNNELSKQK